MAVKSLNPPLLPDGSCFSLSTKLPNRTREESSGSSQKKLVDVMVNGRVTIVIGWEDISVAIVL